MTRAHAILATLLVGCRSDPPTFLDVECLISWRDNVLVAGPTPEGLARVTYGPDSPAEVVLLVYSGWSAYEGQYQGEEMPLEIGDVVTFKVVPKTDAVRLEPGDSVPGSSGRDLSAVVNPRLRISIDGTEIATVGARAGALLSQFFAFSDHEGKLSAFTHTTVSNPDGSTEHWGAPHLAPSQRLTIEVLAPGWVDPPAVVDPP